MGHRSIKRPNVPRKDPPVDTSVGRALCGCEGTDKCTSQDACWAQKSRTKQLVLQDPRASRSDSAGAIVERFALCRCLARAPTTSCCNLPIMRQAGIRIAPCPLLPALLSQRADASHTDKDLPCGQVLRFALAGKHGQSGELPSLERTGRRSSTNHAAVLLRRICSSAWSRHLTLSVLLSLKRDSARDTCRVEGRPNG